MQRATQPQRRRPVRAQRATWAFATQRFLSRRPFQRPLVGLTGRTCFMGTRSFRASSIRVFQPDPSDLK